MYVFKFRSAVKRIQNNKCLLLIPLFCIAMSLIIGVIVYERFVIWGVPFSFEIFRLVYMVIVFELAIISMIGSLLLIATPFGGRKVERLLTEINLVDFMGNPPSLLALKREKDAKIVTMVFYSPKIPLNEYKKLQEDMETILNKKILSIEQGADMQHVVVKTISANKTYPEIIKWKKEYQCEKDFVICLGENLVGKICYDLATFPHWLLAGGTGSGKTECLKLILMQSIRKNAVIYIADFKGGVDFASKWHEKCTIIFTLEDLIGELSRLLEIMEERRNLLLEESTSNISAYNLEKKEKMQRIIFAFDEIADVLDKTGLSKDEKHEIEKVENMLSKIARQGRAFGIHLIFSTQRPDADILKGQIKNNISIRICGRADKILSQIVLDSPIAFEVISQKDKGMFVSNMGDLFKAYYLEGEYFNE